MLLRSPACEPLAIVLPWRCMITDRWKKERGSRVEGSRDLDRSKVQAPCIVHKTGGGFRLFYTAVGPGKPFPECQGYILSAVSEDGVVFEKEPGIRLAPQPDVEFRSLRLLAPSVHEYAEDQWRMYVEARGTAGRPTVISSAVSSDLVNWEHEEGIRFVAFEGVGGPRYVALPGGGGRLYCFATEYSAGGKESGERVSSSVVSAVTVDGVNFQSEPGYRLRDRQSELDAVGITAAEAIPPLQPDGRWSMVFSAWQDAPPGSEIPLHPSHDPDAVATGSSEDFAAASIASDMAGFRSRIFVAYSDDGLEWERGGCAIEGKGYDGEGVDAVHAEDMSVIHLGDGHYRMYYAACDVCGKWSVASAVMGDG